MNALHQSNFMASPHVLRVLKQVMQIKFRKIHVCQFNCLLAQRTSISVLWKVLPTCYQWSWSSSILCQFVAKPARIRLHADDAILKTEMLTRSLSLRHAPKIKVVILQVIRNAVMLRKRNASIEYQSIS